MTKPGKSKYTLYIHEQIISRVVVQPKRVLEHSEFVVPCIPAIESSANGRPAISIIINLS